MVLPDIDSRDYRSANNIYSEQPEAPTELWIIYYQGLSGKWFICLPCLHKENAELLAGMLDRPTKILHYKLHANETFHRKTTKKVKKIAKPTKKVRKVRRVATD